MNCSARRSKQDFAMVFRMLVLSGAVRLRVLDLSGSWAAKVDGFETCI